MAKILFIRPPIDNQPGQLVLRGVPLGPLALGAWLRIHRGDDIRLLDYNLKPGRMIDFPKNLREFEPDVVGFSSYSISGPHVHRMSRQAKEYNPDCEVVVGGPYGRASPMHILGDENVDHVVVGDAEFAFTRLLDQLDRGESISGIPGVACCDDEGRPAWNGEVWDIEDLDQLPILAYDLVDLNEYFNAPAQTYWISHKRRVPILTTRGCPYLCSYCFHMHGTNFRRQSTERVMREIGHLVEDRGIREIQFFDDCFNYDRERALEILTAIADSGYDIRISFPRGLRGDTLDQEFIDAMRRARTYQACIPIETVTPRNQDYVNRRADVHRVRAAIEMADNAGIIVVSNFIVGFPGESRREIQNTIDFAMSTKAHLATFLILNIFEGTDLYDKVKKDYPDVRLSPYVGNFQSTLHNLSQVSDDELVTICARSTRRFHLNPWRIWRIWVLLPHKMAMLQLIGLFMRRVFRRILFGGEEGYKGGMDGVQ
ncbi:B12-binding domain-containing radical SAM protein [Thermodesulfobacteriota bacterium]